LRRTGSRHVVAEEVIPVTLLSSSTCGRSEIGFSLIEVLLGIVIIVFALYGVLDLIANNQNLSLRAQQRTVAIELAAAKTAEIRAAGFDAVEQLRAKSGSASKTFVYPPEPAKFAPPYDAKQFRWQAHFDPLTTQPAVIHATVIVSWTQPGKRDTSDSVAIASLLAKR